MPAVDTGFRRYDKALRNGIKCQMRTIEKRSVALDGADAGLGLRPRNIGARVRRVEDPRLLTGLGAFTDDRTVAGALHLALRRSDHAHASIADIGTAAAAAMLDGLRAKLAQGDRALVGNSGFRVI
jgi:hypothetical protein